MDESLKAAHISTNLASYETAKSAFFVFEIKPQDCENLVSPNFTGELYETVNGVRQLTAAAKAAVINKAGEYIRLNVVKCTLADFSIDSHDMRRGNEIVKYAGMPSWEAGSFTVDDVIGLDTKSILLAWLHLTYNPHTGKGGRMQDYKKTCTMYEYTSDFELVRTWTLEGCFVTKVSNDEWNKEDSNGEKRQLQADFVYDKAIMRLPEEETV